MITYLDPSSIEVQNMYSLITSSLCLYIWEVARGKVYLSFVMCIRTLSSSLQETRVVDDDMHYIHPNNKHFVHKIHSLFFNQQTESQNTAVDIFCTEVHNSYNDMAVITCIYNKFYV
jgi:hypothetical protein